MSSRSSFAFRRQARALAAGLPRQDHVYNPTNESFRFHNKKFDEMRCKLNSTQNPRSFEKYQKEPIFATGTSTRDSTPQKDLR